VVKAEQLITNYIQAKQDGPRFDGETPYEAAIANLGLDIVDEEKLNEQMLELLWKKLPPNIKRKIDLKRVSDFLAELEKGMDLARAALAARIPTAIAVDLMGAIERTGLI